MEKSNQNPMGTKPIASLIFTMGCPPIVSMFVQSMYNIVDSIFVAQLGENALTAVSLAAPIQYILLAVGVGVGINSYISRNLGADNIDEANNTVTHSMILALAHSILFIILGLLFIKPFFRIYANNDAIFSDGCSYTYIVVLLSFSLFFQITFEKVFQATGKMLLPTISQVIGAVLNIILDPIFIFGWFGMPKLGVTGAAIATVIGQIVSFLILLIFFIRNDSVLKIDLKLFKFDWNIIKQIYAVGIPSALMISISSILTIALNSVLVKFSNTAVSIYGIYYRLQTFITMPVNGLVQGIRPIIGFNYGAKKYERAKEAFKYATIAACVICIIGFISIQCFPTQIISLFNNDPELTTLAIKGIRIYLLMMPVVGINIVATSYYQSIGKAKISMFVSLLRQVILLIPFTIILPKFIGLDGVWAAGACADSLSVIITLVLLKKEFKQLDKMQLEKIA